MSDATPRDVTILVKNVYAPASSQQFVLAETITIRLLKEMLQQSVEGNPLPKQQKLIFAGKICDDNDPLSKVLGSATSSPRTRQSDGEDESTSSKPYVLHLMVSGPRSAPTTPVARPQPTPTPSPTPTPTPTTAPAATAHVPPQAPAHGLHGLPSMTAHGVATHTTRGVSTQSVHHHMQTVLLQQQAMLLTQIQYWQHMQAHYQVHGTAQPTAHHAGQHPPAAFAHFGQYPGMFGGFGAPHPPAYGHGLHVPQAPPAAHHAPGHAAQPQQLPGLFARFAAPPVPPAAAGAPGVAPAPARPVGPVAQALREIAPLFDIRLAMKMAFMLFIIGQDTPIDRIIVLALMSFVAYLHITGVLAKVYELYQRANAANNAPMGNNNRNGQDNNGNAAQAGRDAGAMDGGVGVDPSPLTRLLRISPDRGFVQDVRYFVTGLLLSLVPAWHPQPLNGPDIRAAAPEPVGVADVPMQGI